MGKLTKSYKFSDNIPHCFRYDPTQMAQWQAFRQKTIGDSEMLDVKDKEGPGNG